MAGLDKRQKNKIGGRPVQRFASTGKPGYTRRDNVLIPVAGLFFCAERKFDLDFGGLA
jgi:hypothetical protein